jgi:hypothetical protein
MVAKPSNQQRSSKSMFLMRKSTMDSVKSVQMVDVPSHQRDCLELMFIAAHGLTELL